jgi:hypothetical protein
MQSFRFLAIMLTIVRPFAFQHAAKISRKLSSLAASPVYAESDRLSIAVDASSDLVFKSDLDLLVIPFYRPVSNNTELASDLIKLIPKELPTEIRNIVSDILEEGIFKADASSKQLSRIGNGDDLHVRYIVLVGLGANPKKSSDAADLEVQSAFRLGKSVASSAKDIKATSVGVILPAGTGNAGVSQLLLGLHDASYNDNRYKKVPVDGFNPNPLASIQLLGATESVVKDIGVNSKLTNMIASGVNFARDLVGTIIIKYPRTFNLHSTFTRPAFPRCTKILTPRSVVDNTFL